MMNAKRSPLSKAVASVSSITKARNYINSKGVLYLYGIIGDWWDGLDALSIVRQLEDMEGDAIEVRIQSPGGNVLEGLAMYNALKQSPKRVEVYIDGIAASMGAAIAMAGDVVYIPSNALMMLHKPSVEAGGNSNDLRDVADNLDTLEASYIQLHADKTGKAPDEIAALIADGKNHFFRGQEAIDYGLADELIGEIKIAAQAKFEAIELPVKVATSLFTTTAAAAASKPNQEKPMKFRIKSKKGGSKLAAALASALAKQFDSVENALAALASLNVSVDVEKLITGDAEASAEDMSALADALKVDAKQHADEPAAPASPAAPAAASATAVDSAVQAALKAERDRVAAIREIGAQARIEDDEVNRWIGDGLSVEKARAQALEAVAQRDKTSGPASGYIRVNNAEPVGLREAIATAMLVRAVPGQYAKNATEASAQFNGMTLMETVRAYLECNGESTRGKTRNELVAMAMHTTSDFPNIVADVANKELLRAYQAAPRTFTAIARETSVSNFKAKHVVEMGSGSSLEKRNEKGEFKHGTVSESGESYKAESFGRIFSFSRELIINDDLDAFLRFFQLVGGKASQLESDIVWELVTSNPQLSDGTAVFGTGDKRKNQVTGAAINETTLDGLRKSIRQQKDLDGAPLNLSMRTLAVGPNRETEAQKFLATILAGKAADVNPFMNSLQLVVESRLDQTNNPFYGFADPAMAPTLAYCYLEGNREPYIETRFGFETDGVDLKVRHDFGAGWESHRGAAKCTGAA